MKVPILHLADGTHNFEERIESGALHFYRDEIYPEEILLNVELNKFEKNINCEVGIQTQAHYQCDRCLTKYQKEFREKFSVFFHLGEKDFETDEDDVVILSPEQVELDLNPFIIEQLILSVPMKLVCKENCKGICAGCGADLNFEECTCVGKPVDPRWEKLRDLLE